MALEKAKFVDNDSNSEIEVHFNPSSLSIVTNAVVSEQKTQQIDSENSVINAGGISSRKLSVSLILDSYEKSSSLLGGKKRQSVLKVINQFEEFMNTSVNISFIWGKIMFTGVIEELSTQYEMFNSNGTPVRATVNISMSEVDSEDDDSFSFDDLDDLDYDTEESALSALSGII